MLFLSGFWLMIPAYVPNPIAAATGGGTPIDLGRRYRDGKRLLGDGKTIRGFLIGVVAGCICGLIQIMVQQGGLCSSLPHHTLASVILLAVGSLFGDMVKSFFKRRRGIDRGGKWPLVDQYDFVVGALVFLCIGSPSFAISEITLPVLIAILILTPLLHRSVNIIGYKIGVKKEPW